MLIIVPKIFFVLSFRAADQSTVCVRVSAAAISASAIPSVIPVVFVIVLFPFVFE